MRKRVVMRLELTPTAKQTLASISQERGMTQVAVASRLVEWFAKQPESVQTAVLGQYPSDYAPQIARLILSQMAEDDKADETPSPGSS
jgi:hypothetical protein